MPSVDNLAPQPLDAPVNDVGLHALAELAGASVARKRLQERLGQAVKHLTSVAGLLNDRGTEERQRRLKKQARRQASGGEEDGDERRAYEEFQAKVESLTHKMDASIRKVIDDQAWLDVVPEAVRQAITNATVAGMDDPRPTPTQISGPTQASSAAAQRNRRLVEDEDNVDDENTTNGDNDEAAQQDRSVFPPPLRRRRRL